MAADLREGTELAGYRIQVLVARGGMGVVYKATQLSLEREVALKLIAPELASQEAFRERFLREAKLAASLEHPHVLPVYEVGEVDGQLFLALRYVEGADLGSVLAEGPLSPERTRRIVTQLCSALEAAHERGLLHRDVKPENVLLLGREGEEHAYLTDFGLAKPQAERGLTKTGELLGSLAYLAPEQIEKGQSDERSDLYSLGCLLYACLAGKPPFAKEHEAAILWAHLKEAAPLPSEARPELGDAFDRVIERALAKDPAERFSSAAELAAALASDTPPARRKPLSPATTNLPTPASSFLGRERELAELGELLRGEDVRLLTLTGPGGTGKTRLALEAAKGVKRLPDGVYWVGLSALRDAALVTEAISQTLGSKDGLAEHIGEREMLLLLDNLEQVIESAPELSSLLQSCPNLTLLVTSRELLRIQGEVEYRVPPLAEPEAVSLFCERAQVDPSDEIAELCTRLDNLPLAVELAAARVKALAPAQILERLSSRLDLLKGGRDSDPRQQTLRATIEWSYDLLSPEEQPLFARLSVFVGGCTLEAAEEVADADLDTLQSLVEKSLLRFTNERYWMLETIREYAGERLEVSGETVEVRERHANHVLTFSARAGEGLQSSDSRAWLERLEKEHDNIRAALSWMDQAGRPDDQLDLVGHVAEFWKIRGAWHEGRRWIEESLSRSMGERSARRARALGWAGILAWDLGDWEAARTRGMEALSIYRELGEPGDIARSLDSLGALAAERGDHAEAGRLQGEAVVFAREAGVQSVLARVVGNMGAFALAQGDYARATPLIEESLALYREVGRDYGVAIALLNLADCLFHTERDDEAVLAARECLMLTRWVQDVPTTIWMFLLLASVAVRRGDLEVGARFTGIAHDVVERFDFALSGAEAELDHSTVARLRDSLGEETYVAALREGREMASDDPIAFALSYLD